MAIRGHGETAGEGFEGSDQKATPLFYLRGSHGLSAALRHLAMLVHRVVPAGAEHQVVEEPNAEEFSSLVEPCRQRVVLR